MKRTHYLPTALLLGLALSFTACDDDPDDPVVPNEEELITTVTYTLTPDGGGTPVTLNFSDPDGDGGNAPTVTEGTLAANTTYAGVLSLLNEVEDPAENITAEIQEEDEEHQFFFQSTVDGLSVAYDDQDEDGNPIGLATTVTTGEPASGTLTVILRHEPDKSGDGVSEGSIANAGGETDIEVSFDVDVQ